MPYSPKKPCAYGRCPNLTDGRYCTGHRAMAVQRLSSSARGYGSQWRGIRERVLAARCRQCEVCGTTEGRLDVDHIDGDNTNMQADNLRVLCVSCHSRVTAKSTGLGRR